MYSRSHSYRNRWQPYGNSSTISQPMAMWQSFKVSLDTPAQQQPYGSCTQIGYNNNNYNYGYSYNSAGINGLPYGAQVSTPMTYPHTPQPLAFSGPNQMTSQYFANVVPQLSVGMNAVPVQWPLLVIRPPEPSSVNGAYQATDAFRQQPPVFNGRPQYFSAQSNAMPQQNVVRPTAPSSVSGTHQLPHANRLPSQLFCGQYAPVSLSHAPYFTNAPQNAPTAMPAARFSPILIRPAEPSYVNGAYHTADAFQHMPMMHAQQFTTAPANPWAQSNTIRPTELLSMNTSNQYIGGFNQSPHLASTQYTTYQRSSMVYASTAPPSGLPFQGNIGIVQPPPAFSDHTEVPANVPFYHQDDAEENTTNEEEIIFEQTTTEVESVYSDDSTGQNSGQNETASDTDNTYDASSSDSADDESDDDSDVDEDFHNYSYMSVHTTISVDSSDIEVEEITIINIEVENHTLKYEYVENCRQSNESDEECAICLGEFVTGDSVRRLRCSHVFHVDCVDKWFFMQRHNCPLCRTMVVGAKM